MRIILIFLLVFVFLSVQADTGQFSTQRLVFLQAKRALEKHSNAQFQLLSRELRDYPLYPYLVYWDLLQQLDRVSEQNINAFLQAYADTPLAARLRFAWLSQLAEQKRWPLFLNYYQSSKDKALQCWDAQALLNTGQQTAAMRLIPNLWLSSETLPKNCDAVFIEWNRLGGLSNDLVQQRIELAIDDNNNDLTKNLLPLLSAQQQAFIKLQLLAKKDPQQVITQGMAGFSETQQQIMTRTIAISLARLHDSDAIAWLNKVDAQYSNQTVREWRVRMAILQNNWPQVMRMIAQLTPTERASSVWRYWQAYALAEQNNVAQAQIIYRALARQVSYYGVLASEQLQQSYRPQNNIDVNAQAGMNDVMSLPAIQRAHELYYLGLTLDARREWNWQIARMDPAQLRAAAYLAKTWSWYDRAIATAIQVGNVNDLSLRYPLAYTQQIKNAAHRYGLNPAWVFAITRQESQFMKDSKSGVGAVGLMQLMPETAKLLLNNLNLNSLLKNNSDGLFDTNANVQLGSAFLKQLLDDYKGNVIAATAAYNAGPSRVQKYLPAYQQLGAQVWVETLPWRETRDYVKNVMLGLIIYQQQIK